MKPVRLQYVEWARAAATAHSVRRNGKYSGAGFLVLQHVFEHLTIHPRKSPRFKARVNPAGVPCSKVHDRNRAHALHQELRVVCRSHCFATPVDLFGSVSIDVDLAVPLDIDDTFDIEDVHLPVPTEGNGS